MDGERQDSVGRFTGLAREYARYRPGYPEELFDCLQRECGLKPGAAVVDVGCGTGIATRQMAARGWAVVGVEPNDEMRGQAEREQIPAGGAVPRYVAGRAEATGLQDGSAHLVLCAQAFHWFRPGEALAEFHRLLRPGGHVALVWNEREESDPFTHEYGEAVRSLPEAARLEAARQGAGEAVLSHPGYEDGRVVEFRGGQVVDEEGLLGRAFSLSYAPREPAAAEAFACQLRRVWARHQRGGWVEIVYRTTLYLARRRAGPPPAMDADGRADMILR